MRLSLAQDVAGGHWQAGKQAPVLSTRAQAQGQCGSSARLCEFLPARLPV